jgi:hypothetical protein
MAELGYAWDDIRTLPAGWEKGEAALGARLELSAILARDFAQAGLWGLKDPRLCRLLPLWSALFAQLKVKPSFILLLRHPRDVVASLAARDGLSAARAGLLWLRHVLEAERETRGHPRTIVHYQDLVAGRGWRSVVSQISREIGVIWPAGGPSAERAIDAYLSSDLRHCRSSDHSPGAATTGTMQGWLEAIYSAASSAEEPRLRDICDAVSCELDHAGELFLPIIGEVTPSPVVSFSGRQHPQDREIAELTQRLTGAELESAELRALVSQKDRELKALKQAGAAVAAGNSRLLPPHAVAEAFPRWIESRASTALAHLDWVAERTGQWPFLPKLALGMILSADNEARVALTLRSLLLQTVGDWELHVVAEQGVPEPFAGEPRLFWHQDNGCPADALNRCLAHSDAHWVALDRRDPHRCTPTTTRGAGRVRPQR